jgi:glycosyltransferase involved in cell wall biosynthesis
VRFLGFVPSPAPLYDAAHFVLVPSQVESFGLVAVEGMSAGRVVVAAPVGGLLDSVLPGVTGELCPPEPGALAEVVQRRLTDWEGSRALAARAAEEAERVFGLDAFDRRLLAVLGDATPVAR